MGLDHGLRYRYNEVDVDIITWRKCNQIRGWFANNIEDFEDNGETVVYGSDLKRLYKIIGDIVEAQLKSDIDEAQSLIEIQLPPTKGFFFGSDKIDSWYFWGLIDTMKQLERFVWEEFDCSVDNIDDDEEFTYWEWY